MTYKRTIRGSAVRCLLLLGVILRPTAAGAQAPTPDPQQNRPTTASAPMPVYKPPAVGAPSWTMGGATRGDNVIALLGPRHGGLTTQAQPTLYWHLAQPTTDSLEFTLTEGPHVKAVRRIPLPSSSGVGLHMVRLADYQLQLRRGAWYVWSIESAPASGRLDAPTVARGAIRRIDAPAQLARQLRHAPPQEAVFIYATAGIWYDALDAISQAIATQPDAVTLRGQRAGLLSQIGLMDPISADANAATPPH